MANTKTIDLSSHSVPELRELSTRIATELANREDTEKASLRAEFEKKARESGYTLADILPASTERKAPKLGKSKGGTVPPKYRNPTNPAETWTGRGRSPAWVKAHKDAGGNMDALLITTA